MNHPLWRAAYWFICAILSGVAFLFCFASGPAWVVNLFVRYGTNAKVFYAACTIISYVGMSLEIKRWLRNG